jgi:hypothetical protein
LVSFNDSAFVNQADGLSKLFFKFDKLGVMGSTAQLRLQFLLLVFVQTIGLSNSSSSLTNSQRKAMRLLFKFDKLGVMGSTAQLRLRFLLLVKLAAWPCRSGKTVWLLPASGDPPACIERPGD